MHGAKKKIVLFTLVCFIWGMTLSSSGTVPDDGTKKTDVSGLVEKTGQKKARKKIPWVTSGLLVAAAVGVLLLRKREQTALPGFEMVFIQGGTFLMGSNTSGSSGDERPVHSVTLSSYLISKTEVTQALWQAVMGYNPSYFKNGGNYPVELVSWTDVREFFIRINVITGKKYQLPTEAQWEFAARGGTLSDRYGNLNEIAWYRDNSSGSTHLVGSRLPNRYGIHDMLGNVWEWCSDIYSMYTSEPQEDPTGPRRGVAAVLRGGSWLSYDPSVRVTKRLAMNPGSKSQDWGFRIVEIPSPSGNVKESLLQPIDPPPK